MTIPAVSMETAEITNRLAEEILATKGDTKQSPDQQSRASALATLQAETENKEEDISLNKLHHVTEAVDSYMASLGVQLKFHVDERTDTVQVEVRDPKTEKLIRKIPADEMLDLAASIESMVGLFLDTKL